MSETAKKRDKFFAADQDLCGSGLSALGTAISRIFNSAVEEVDTQVLLQELIEAGKLLCELQRQLTKARRAFIIPTVDKEAKCILKKTEPGEFLFGPDLSHMIKSAKAVEKLGLMIKLVHNEKKPTFQASASLNWKGPPARGRNQAGRGRGSAPYRGQGQFKTRQSYAERTPFSQQQSRAANAAGSKK